MRAAGGLAADLLFDGMMGAASFPSHAPVKVVHAQVSQLHRELLGDRAINSRTENFVGDSIMAGTGLREEQADKLSKALHDLQHGNLSGDALARARAEAGGGMRNSVNPTARTVKSLQAQVEHKIEVREALLKRNGALSGEEAHELQNMYASREMLHDLEHTVGNLQTRFKQADADHNIFTGGQHFRRRGLNGAAAVARFTSRHRIAVITAIMTLLTIVAISSFMNSLNAGKRNA